MGSLLHYAIVFLIVAVIAAFFGFGGVAGTAMEGVQILFWVALVLFVVSAVAGIRAPRLRGFYRLPTWTGVSRSFFARRPRAFRISSRDVVERGEPGVGR